MQSYSFETINIVGLTLLGLFALFTLQKKSKQLSDYLLMGVQAMLGLLLISEMHISLWNFAIHILIPYFLMGVFAIYVLSLLSPSKRLGTRDLLFFAPALLASVLVALDVWVWNSYSPGQVDVLCAQSNFFYEGLKKGYQGFSVVVLLFLLQKIRRYQVNLREHLSYIEPYQLKWLWNLSLIYLAVISLTMLSYGLYGWGLIDGDLYPAHAFVDLCMVIGISMCCYRGIRSYSWETYHGKEHLEPMAFSPSPLEVPEVAAKYRHSSLAKSESEAFFQLLEQEMARNKTYLQPKLSVQELAETLGVTSHVLSQTINEQGGQPFYDYVNAYRVRHLKQLLVDPANTQYTILALGLESGFNSKASINRIFKINTGLTPSAYQQQHLPKDFSPTQTSLT